MLDFARLPQMRGCYRDYFFRDVDMAGFDFIGDMSFSMKNWDGLRLCLVSEELALWWAGIPQQLLRE